MGRASGEYVEAALRYAEGVVEGRVVANKWVKLAAQRHLTDLKRSREPDYPYRFDPVRAEAPCEFIENLPHVKGKWAKQRELLVLGDWQ